MFRNTHKKRNERAFSVKWSAGVLPTLGRVAAVRQKIAKIRIWSLQLCSIEKGCVCLRFWIPSHVADVVLPVSLLQQEALCDISIGLVLDQAEDSLNRPEDQRYDH